CAHVGSTPTTRSAPPPAARRDTCPSPQPTSSTRPAPARCAAAMGRICSTYSASAPSVNPSCHQRATSSLSQPVHAGSPSTTRVEGYGLHVFDDPPPRRYVVVLDDPPPRPAINHHGFAVTAPETV